MYFFQFSCRADRLRVEIGDGASCVNVKVFPALQIFYYLSFTAIIEKADPGFMKWIKKRYIKSPVSWNGGLQFSESLKRPDVFLLKAANLFSF